MVPDTSRVASVRRRVLLARERSVAAEAPSSDGRAELSLCGSWRGMAARPSHIGGLLDSLLHLSLRIGLCATSRFLKFWYYLLLAMNWTIANRYGCRFIDILLAAEHSGLVLLPVAAGPHTWRHVWRRRVRRLRGHPVMYQETRSVKTVGFHARRWPAAARCRLLKRCPITPARSAFDYFLCVPG